MSVRFYIFQFFIKRTKRIETDGLKWAYTYCEIYHYQMTIEGFFRQKADEAMSFF